MRLSKIMLAMTSILSSVSFAASQSMVWGEVDKSLQGYQLISPAKSATKFGFGGKFKKQSSDYQLDYKKRLVSKSGSDERYQIKYKGLPVWGHQIIFHQDKQGKVTATGVMVSDIEKDVPTIDAKLTPQQVEEQLLAEYKGKPIKVKNIKKVIYLDDSNKAHLAYHFWFYTKGDKKQVLLPNFIVDANSGNVFKRWNAARKERVGQGMGGNAFPLPYRPGMFQHGDALPGLPSLGKFDVRIEDGTCHVENNDFRVMSLENEVAGYEAFPISVIDEAMYGFKAFSYPCDASTNYINYADGTSGPMNYSFSPINDTMYFAQETLDMYQNVYGMAKPFGDDMPMRAYTHLGEMDNAFAIPPIEIDGVLYSHQQIVIGNGDMFLTAPAQSVIGHELSHNFTFSHSDLVYEGQPGGLNESFSDMAAIALEDYISKKYPWYWDGKDFSIGREAMISGDPLRYMDDPTKDGYSIGHADDYYDGMEVHFSSGVFNKAFYLLSHKENWDVQKAFQVMVDANSRYWSPIAYFDFAACGVIQAAADRDYDTTPVIESFDEVGVHCPMFKKG